MLVFELRGVYPQSIGVHSKRASQKLGIGPWVTFHRAQDCIIVTGVRAQNWCNIVYVRVDIVTRAMFLSGYMLTVSP